MPTRISAYACSHPFLLGFILEYRYILKVSSILLHLEVLVPLHCSGSGLVNSHLDYLDISNPLGA